MAGGSGHVAPDLPEHDALAVGEERHLRRLGVRVAARSDGVRGPHGPPRGRSATYTLPSAIHAAAELPAASAATSGAVCAPRSPRLARRRATSALASACPGPSTSRNAATSRGSRTRRWTIGRLSRPGRRNATATSPRPAGCLLSTARWLGRSASSPCCSPRPRSSPAAARAAGPARTRSALATQMRAAGGGSGALAVDLDSGRQIFASRRGRGAHARVGEQALHDRDRAHALRLEGHLTTRAMGDVGVDPGGVLIGNLYLRGGGDPSFGSRQASELADKLVLDQGLREITGRVIGDESAFDSLRGPPSEGFRVTSEVGPAERADLQPRPHRQAPPLLPGQPGALRRPRVRARAAPPRRRHRRRRAGRAHAAGGDRARRAQLAHAGRAGPRDQPPVGQLQRRDADQGARRPSSARRHDARRRGRRAADDGGLRAAARGSSTARASRAPTAPRRARS